jgi:hypothetical protein
VRRWTWFPVPMGRPFAGRALMLAATNAFVTFQ